MGSTQSRGGGGTMSMAEAIENPVYIDYVLGHSDIDGITALGKPSMMLHFCGQFISIGDSGKGIVDPNLIRPNNNAQANRELAADGEPGNHDPEEPEEPNLEDALPDDQPTAAPRGSARDYYYLLLSDGTIRVDIPKQHKDAVLLQINSTQTRSAVRYEPHYFNQVILKQPIRMNVRDVVNMLNRIDRNMQIRISTFGCKSTLMNGLISMQQLRRGDPRCHIKFDLAAIFQSKYSQEFNPNNPEYPTDYRTVAIASCDMVEIHRAYCPTNNNNDDNPNNNDANENNNNNNSYTVEHYPIYPVSQARATGYTQPPGLGSFNIISGNNPLVERVKVYDTHIHHHKTNSRRNYNNVITVRVS